jgi:hypothetical protein
VIEHLFKAGGAVQDSGRKGVGVRDNGVGYTWASIATTWWEKGGPAYGIVPGQGRTQPKGAKGLPLEVGTAVLRCANLRALVRVPACYAEARTSGLLIHKTTTGNPIS